MFRDSELEAARLLGRLRNLAKHEPMLVLREVRSYLDGRALSDSIVPVLLFGGREKVSLEAVSPRGEQLLEDIVFYAELDPCPPGMCVPTTSSLCEWCGTLLH